MWHEIVSSLDTTVQLIIFGFVLIGSQHPVATVGIILFFAVVAAMLILESIEDRRASSRSRAAGPIRLQR